MVDDEQYVTVLAGWGGIFGLLGGLEIGKVPKHSRILTYKLNGTAILPATADPQPKLQPPARITEDEAVVETGRRLYVDYCMDCHGFQVISNGAMPDLRYLPASYYDNFNNIVLDGALRKMGMVGFKDVLTEDQAFAVKVYILDKANDNWELHQQPGPWIAFKNWMYSYLAKILAWFVRLTA